MGRHVTAARAALGPAPHAVFTDRLARTVDWCLVDKGWREQFLSGANQLQRLGLKPALVSIPPPSMGIVPAGG